MQAETHHGRKEIRVGHVTMKSDVLSISDRQQKLCIVSLMPRRQTTAQLLANTAEGKTGMLGKMEVALGVYMAVLDHRGRRKMCSQHSKRE
jgi:hypothetical protein